jgi:hypothetical protein
MYDGSVFPVRTANSARRRWWRRSFVVAAVAIALLAGTAAGASAAPAPDLGRAVHYLATTTGASGIVNGTSLAHDGYWEAFDQFADFGLTIDGAFALAATGTDNTTLQHVVTFLREAKTDPSGNSVDSWTGIGTQFASGGSIGKEALLAEVTGYDPRAFGGHDLIAALTNVICTTTDVPNGCGGSGNYAYSTSTFSQAFGVIAAIRAGDTAGAAGPVAFLESLQQSSGAWPSFIPSTGDSDVDSTAMAAMALALLPDDATAAAAVTHALTWIAGRQSPTGGFAGVAVDSTNSTGLARQALMLAGSQYASHIAKTTTFLAARQNADGGFDVSAGDQSGSDARASAQAVGGIVGTSFGTLSDVLAPDTGATTTTTSTAATSTTVTTSTTVPTSTTVGTSTGGQSTPTTPAVTATTSMLDPGTGVSPDTLPATGADARGLFGWVVALMVFGAGATVAGRRRGLSARGARESRRSGHP